ncbi:MAG: folate-binding protein, partial [Pseudomonadota bacterium]
IAASQDQLSGGGAFADPRLPALGWRAIKTPSASAQPGDYHARRIDLGVPEFGADFAGDEKFLLDVNYDSLNGVNYKKGCFVGQEVTSRMKRKGEARRRTLIAAFKDAAPQKGENITTGASTLGEIMSTAGNLALAQIRVDRWEKARAEGETISCAGEALQLHIPAYLEQR